MKTDFLTVATVDYAPQALATLRSARRHTNYASFNFFALDAPPETISRLRTLLGKDAAWIKIFGPHDLAYQRERFLSAFAYFTPFELSCFAKYIGVAHLLRQPDAADVCIYSDADIFFTADISQTCQDVRGHAVLATPHHLGPAPDSQELDRMVWGWLNAGFFCVDHSHPETNAILDWLIDRIAKYGFVALDQYMAADQVWLSSSVFVFGDRIRVSRDAGWNVAYWNLRERPLIEQDGTIMTYRKPLLFFHFSGFDRTDPLKLSKHATDRVAPGSALARLCEQYRDALAETEAQVGTARILARLPTGPKNVTVRIRLGFHKNGLNPSFFGSRSGILVRSVRKLLSVLSGNKNTGP